FEAISRAGQTLEQVWRGIQHGDIMGTDALGAALEGLSSVLTDAVEADPEDGTPTLNAAHSELNKVLAEEPDASEDIDSAPIEGEGDRRNGTPANLGGLLSALEDWATADSILVNAGTLYRLINESTALRIHADALVGTESSPEVERLSTTARSVQMGAIELASVPLTEITNTLPQLVRYLAKKTEKGIRFELVGDDLAVDRQVLERVSDPIRQLLVNSIQHGVEHMAVREEAGKLPTATIAVRASVKDNQLEVTVSDDGAGIDWEAVEYVGRADGFLEGSDPATPEQLRALLFEPGFTTVQTPTELVGEGDGLADVVKAIESLNGSLHFESSEMGTTVTFRVPTSRALQRALIVRTGSQQWGIPEAAVLDVLPMSEVEILEDKDRSEMLWREHRIVLTSLGDLIGHPGHKDNVVIMLSSRSGPVAVCVPEVVESRDVAAKELGPLLQGPSHLTGAALLGSDRVVLLVDAARLAEQARAFPEGGSERAQVLVVDDSQGAREVVAGVLSSAGFSTIKASDAAEALTALADKIIDAVVVDYAMPGSDGITLIEQIRQSFGRIPVVMLSGVATADDQQRAVEAGADAYYDKSDFREGVLADTLRSLVASRGTEETP
ncbi:MAG: response regulator, partial [Acidimicrobiia bacterium]|nr:response regulator [Acidimicrobiia bacterium]